MHRSRALKGIGDLPHLQLQFTTTPATKQVERYKSPILKVIRTSGPFHGRS